MHRPRRALARLSLAALLALAAGCAKSRAPGALTPSALTVRVGQIDPVALEAAMQSAPRSLAVRTEQLVDALWQAGCLGADIETPPRGSGSPDVVCTLRGRTARRIAVVSHLDAEADGASPRWSGVALLPFLYRALAAAPREHTFVFAAFGKSPRRSARGYLTRLGPPHSDDVRAIVDLQAVDPTSIGFVTADEGLRRDFVAAFLAVGRPRGVLHPFPPAAGENRTDTALLTIAAPPPARAGRTPPAVEAAPKVEAASLASTARFVAVFLAYADETLRLRAEARDAPPPALEP